MTSTRRSLAAALGGLALLASAGTALAQPAPKAAVDVRIGAGLQMEVDRLGRREFKVLSDDLKDALAGPAGRGGFTRLDLTLEYARNNRPTINQLGLDPGLSFTSLGIGGATVTGTAYRADGAAAPLKFSWYEDNLADELGANTWSDAQRAFQLLGDDLARGRTPDRFGPGQLQPRPALDRHSVF